MLFNALTKYVSGYLKKPTSEPGDDAMSIVGSNQPSESIAKKNPTDRTLKGSGDEDCFENVGEMGLREDAFPTLVPNTITTKEVEDNEWIFIADKTTTASLNLKGSSPADENGTTSKMSYASTASKLPKHHPMTADAGKLVLKNGTTATHSNNPRAQDGGRCSNLKCDPIKSCDTEKHSPKDVNLSAPYQSTSSSSGGGVKLSPKNVKNVSVQVSSNAVTGKKSCTIPSSSPTNTKPRKIATNSCRTQTEEVLAKKGDTAFLLIDKHLDTKDKYDTENGAVLLNEHKLVTLTQKVDSLDREVGRAAAMGWGSNKKSQKNVSHLRASIKSLKSDLKAAVSLAPGLNLVPITKSSNTNLQRDYKSNDTNDINDTTPCAKSWEIYDAYNKTRQRLLNQNKGHCFLDDEVQPGRDNKHKKRREILDRVECKAPNTSNNDKERNATTPATQNTSTSPPINRQTVHSTPLTADAGSDVKPKTAATMNVFLDTWDRRKGHCDKSKAFKMAQKEALKSYRRHRNTDSTGSLESGNQIPSVDTAERFSFSSLTKKLKGSAAKKIKKSSIRNRGKNCSSTSLDLQEPNPDASTSVKNLNSTCPLNTCIKPLDGCESKDSAMSPTSPISALFGCDRHFSRKYLARKKKALAQKRNPYNGKFFQYMTSSAVVSTCQDQQPINQEAGNSECEDLSKAKTDIGLLKGKKKAGGRFFYGQKGGFPNTKKRSFGLIQQPIPKSYILRK